jgi:uncharacterized phage-associated protein
LLNHYLFLYLCLSKIILKMFGNLKTEKIGNLLIYLAQNIDKLYKTKALKLLYIIDETAIKTYGVPITWLEYKAWQFGPVAEEIFDNVNNIENSPFKEYISVEKPAKNNSIIIANKKFDDGEFSDAEMDLIDTVIKQYGNYSATELIDLLHQKDTLWHRAVNTHNLDKVFELQNGKSNCGLEFVTLLADDKMKQVVYKTAFDALEFHQSLHKN